MGGTGGLWPYCRGLGRGVEVSLFLCGRIRGALLSIGCHSVVLGSLAWLDSGDRFFSKSIDGSGLRCSPERLTDGRCGFCVRCTRGGRCPDQAVDRWNANRESEVSDAMEKENKPGFFDGDIGVGGDGIARVCPAFRSRRESFWGRGFVAGRRQVVWPRDEPRKPNVAKQFWGVRR